jgi:ubiquitin C-terminal hydrolase
MIQLKRFHYDFNLDKNVKILDSLEYEETIDLSKWSAGQSSNMEYELYAVMVHEGSKAESGHYYNFVKSEEKWYKCNDECVQEVNKEKVFNYNFGGFHESLEFDAR